MNNFELHGTPEQVAKASADHLFSAISRCVEDRGVCHVVLPGGTTPARCLQLLSAMSLPWDSIHWYPGDERCLPVGDAERNDTMIRQMLFTTRPDDDHLHAIPAELGPDQAAARYSDLLDSVGRLDIVMLGMGEDGHTASLFPGNKALDDERAAVPVYDAPKPPHERVSIGLKMLRDADERFIIATGANKRDALARIIEGDQLPVAMTEPQRWFVDDTAMPQQRK